MPVEIDPNFPDIEFECVNHETVKIITIEVPSSLSDSIQVSPSDIISIPKITQNRNRKRQGKKSEILSGTPYKNSLIENEKEKCKKKIIFKKSKQ